MLKDAEKDKLHTVLEKCWERYWNISFLLTILVTSLHFLGLQRVEFVNWLADNLGSG